MANESIYFVFNPAGDAPKQKHGSLNEARLEAERLAGLMPDQDFFVCRCVESVKRLTSPFYRKIYSKKG